MATKLELQEELRKKQFQARVLHERRRSSLGSDAEYNTERISKEQEKLRKQHQRLENEKQHHKEHSFLTRDRRLSLPDDQTSGGTSPSALTPDLLSKSVHTPDYSKVKSRLYNYEKVASPRGRRQLVNSAQGSPAHTPLPPRSIVHTPNQSPLPIPYMSSHAMEAQKASYTDIVKNVARLPHSINNSEKPSKEAGGRNSTEQNFGHDNKVSFREDEIFEVSSARGRSRRGSLPASLPKPLLQKRRGSLPAPDTVTSKPPSRARRHSMPASGALLPKIAIDDAPDLAPDVDEDETRLAALYNKAIQTVQLADESILAGCLPLPNQLQLRRFSSDKSSGSGFDLATLKELESILSDARVYSKRKGSTEEYSCVDMATKRAQRKRIDHLEQVLKKLNPTYDTNVDIDPMKVLQCSYLRLSKSNIETLEKMAREQGKDAGIHIHMDVKDYDIWKNLKEERVDLQKPPIEEDLTSRSSKLKRPIRV